MSIFKKLGILMAVLVMVFRAPSAAWAGDVFHMPAGQTSIEFVPVGDVGNVADSTGYGAVDRFGKYHVTSAPRSGNAGRYAYSVANGYDNFPVNYVSWGNAARFVNWLSVMAGAMFTGLAIGSTDRKLLFGRPRVLSAARVSDQSRDKT